MKFVKGDRVEITEEGPSAVVGMYGEVWEAVEKAPPPGMFDDWTEGEPIYLVRFEGNDYPSGPYEEHELRKI